MGKKLTMKKSKTKLHKVPIIILTVIINIIQYDILIIYFLKNLSFFTSLVNLLCNFGPISKIILYESFLKKLIKKYNDDFADISH